MALTESQIAIVKSTAPVLKEHGNAITTLFYSTLLAENPSLKNMFSLRNQQTGAQQKALANAVLGYATYIDDLPKLRHAVERIAQKHAALFVSPEQYDVVGVYLMRAIASVLGAALTPEIADAWTAAYAALAGVFVAREKELYAENGPWTQWRRFVVERRVDESESVTSFYLAPVDGVAPLPKYRPGQYVSVRIPIPLEGATEPLYQSRQFSLSEAPRADMAAYRVSVKRERTVAGASAQEIAQGLVPGLVSNLLHDTYHPGMEVELSAPQGEFFVDVADATKADAPLVLVAAGVGATPLVSIMDATLAAESKTRERSITWIQAARSSASLVFAHHVREVTRRHENVRSNIFLSEVREGDSKGEEYDFAHTLDLGQLDAQADLFLGNAAAEYYICGPEPWMVAVRARLAALGVGTEQMHLELFATGDVPAQ